MSLRRAVIRASELAAPLRKTPKRDQARLGTYPVPPEAHIWWSNRFQVPGGEIKQSFSMFQQKIMWQWFWNAPARWYWRLSKWAWPSSCQLASSMSSSGGHANAMSRLTSGGQLGGNLQALRFAWMV
eukprot:CAMPEP_0178444152 /NCGR_PEP_ID=MMETSP0689_2-20121128/39327_1 /TAXON_ID=160604 /ORGANISM="Amphidinium massartii, Strain CS-259" /LENGTH=126 /DNA_ID=CAMNT_0020068309 /DNA_START=83 /DNA_END=464 /DNA_ORIENTATION=+